MSSASSAVSSAFSSATAKATSNGPNAGMSTTGIIFTSLAAIVTLLALVAGTIYFTGYADDVAEWWAKRYYKAKAIAEVKVLENVGSEKVEGALKDSLKKNPIMGEDELDKVSGGLGKEAAEQGLGGVSDRLGGLGKF
ncbi:hypothetical protein PV05_01737 [Exophiala xenobiotica]|uniref:Uncharacterized protein n=1 Tax=Exophiala xenobiotica TaxID=348802 RepID=A0A0D2F153_9EURO|nr:uncharacterized protein PV05_01737 [Exophiala xenobiotica]KIW61638.1 hypothetical protein PV05_01737 [Exophiala xenobiotica]